MCRNRNPAEAGSCQAQSRATCSYSKTPVPDSDTLSGTLVALVAMLSLADLLAAASGENVTEVVHDAPAARLAGQLFV